ncbi:GH1 family beta-glucosidase [Micromonospora sp. NPDC051300]|uniref:GH1 family beta-glucosidase n=1 Tax=Micromonospora sp. NPDC051300 TaxID=3364286 RepID=UPI0037B38513
MLRFPPDFVWGTATAAYQIEGAAQDDGRAASIWDTFCATPGKVRNGDSGLVACDHYYRLDEDLDVIARLGVGAYRFSVSWPRVVGDDGRVNQKGLDFYRRIVDGLHRRGVRPLVTLYHWDLPQRLEDRGGWTARDTAAEFADYARVVHEALAGEVEEFTTLNEPWVSAFMGYGNGMHAPGRTDQRAAVTAAHHLLLGHGLAAAAMRAADPRTKVGVTLNLSPVVPFSDTDADRDAARRYDGQQNRLFLDALLRGKYPADVVELFRDVTDFAFVRDGDMALIGAPLDHLGINYYRPNLVMDEPGSDDPVRAGVRMPPGVEVTSMGWPVQPEGLTDLLVRLRDDYQPVPLYVTENGAAFDDVIGADGEVDDQRRIAYLRGHLQAAHAALRAGVDLRGYFVWSLLDNFEWAEGYAKRFGLVYVDYATQRRIPKSSARWYAGVIRDGGVENADETR